MPIFPNLLHDSLCSTLSRYMCHLTTLSTTGDRWMSMQHWWNDADRGRLKYCENEQSHCHFIHHKSNMDWAGIARSPLWWQAEMQLPEPWHSLLSRLKMLPLQSQNLQLLLWKTPTCIMKLTVTMSGQYPCFIFGMSQVQISASRPATLTEVFHVFPQILWIEAGIVPRITLGEYFESDRHHFLLRPFQSLYSLTTTLNNTSQSQLLTATVNKQ